MLVEQAHVVRRDAHREHRFALHQSFTFVVREDEHPLELIELADATPRLPTPVVPVLVRHVWIERPAEGPRAQVRTIAARRSEGGRINPSLTLRVSINPLVRRGDRTPLDG